MATYKETVGTAVTNYAGNNPGVVEGELWYDSTNKDFKYQYPAITTSGSWASAGTLNQARSNITGAGIISSSVAFGGQVGATLYANTELYNGAWTEVNNLNTARYAMGGNGISTSALGYGGNKVPSPGSTDTESWNGTNWTAVNVMNTSRSCAEGS